MNKVLQSLMLSLLLIPGCSTASGPEPGNSGLKEPSSKSVVFEGPDLVAAIGFHHATEGIGGEWVILATQFAGPKSDEGTLVHRTDITIRTPDGHRLTPLGQEEYRENFAKLRIPIERALSYLPILGRRQQSQIPCRRWFIEEPGTGIGQDEILVNYLQVCSGPLVFRVPGGVQPGRWRLVIELEESTVDMPFLIENDR